MLNRPDQNGECNRRPEEIEAGLACCRPPIAPLILRSGVLSTVVASAVWILLSALFDPFLR